MPGGAFRYEALSLRPALRRGVGTPRGLLPGQSPTLTSPVPSLHGLGNSRAKSTDGVKVLEPWLCRLTGSHGWPSHRERNSRGPVCRFLRLSVFKLPLGQLRVPRGWCLSPGCTEKEVQRDGSFTSRGYRVHELQRLGSEMRPALSRGQPVAR